MEKKVLATISSTQRVDSESEQVELTTAAVYRSGKFFHEICYEESQATGLEGSVTTVRLDGDGTVSVRRSGRTDSLLLIKEGETNLCAYDTGYGQAMLGITGTRVHSTLDDGKGALRFLYSLTVDGALLSENEVSITLKESSTDELSC